MDVILGPLLRLLITVIDIYIFVLFVAVIFSWLYAFNVINTSNRFVYMVGDITYRLTEPALRPIRSILPNLGGVDLSPLALILLLYLLKDILAQLFFKLG
ncbi:MAG: YggT family protein [Rhodobacterales bacterium]|nr:YggT family protein [Rhodobacterales bacterium]